MRKMTTHTIDEIEKETEEPEDISEFIDIHADKPESKAMVVFKKR